MYCQNCGAEIAKEAYVCPKCGVRTHNEQTTNVEDKPNMGLNIVALLLLPILGIILYFVWKKDTPIRAKSILTYALIGWGISFAFGIISLITSSAMYY